MRKKISKLKIKMPFFILFLLIFSSVTAGNIKNGLIDSLKQERIDFIPYTRIYRSGEKLNVETVDSLIDSGKLELAHQNATQGYSQSFFWIHFKIEWKEEYQALLLELDNPHIDNVNLYQKVDGAYTKIGFGGDRNRTFRERSYINRRYIFPLDNTQGSTDYFMVVDKRNASVSFPLWLWDKKTFESHETRLNIYFGLFFGVIFFVGFISIFTGLFVRKKIFFFYGSYTLSIGLYLFTALGFSFQYLYPGSEHFNNYSRVLLSIIIAVFAMLFLRALLSIDKNLPKVSRYFKWVTIILAVLTVNWVLFAGLYRIYTIWLLNITNVLFLSIFILAFIAAFKTYRSDKTSAIIFFVAFGFMIIGVVAYLAVEYGAIEESLFPLNPILIGSGFEISILSVAMVQRLTSIVVSKENLEKKMLVLEKNTQSLEANNVELKKAAQRLKKHLSNSKINTPQYLKTIVLKSKAVLQVDDIMHVSSDGHYLEFYMVTKNTPEVDRNTIKSVIKQLPGELFVQVHRSHIVNVKFLKIIKASELILKDGKSIPVSRSFKTRVKEVIIEV